ncbi:MAG: hypothetical protein RR902_03725, partial [Oscillospiraceae bacterium]
MDNNDFYESPNSYTPQNLGGDYSYTKEQLGYGKMYINGEEVKQKKQKKHPGRGVTVMLVLC